MPRGPISQPNRNGGREPIGLVGFGFEPADGAGVGNTPFCLNPEAGRVMKRIAVNCHA